MAKLKNNPLNSQRVASYSLLSALPPAELGNFENIKLVADILHSGPDIWNKWMAKRSLSDRTKQQPLIDGSLVDFSLLGDKLNEYNFENCIFINHHLDKFVSGYYVNTTACKSHLPDRFAGSKFKNCTFEKGKFIRTQFDQSSFIECMFIDCYFTDCEMSNVEFDKCIFNDFKFCSKGNLISFYGCEIEDLFIVQSSGAGWELCNNIIKNSRFQDLELPLSTIRLNKIDNCVFDCVDFSDSQWSDNIWKDSNLESLIMRNASLCRDNFTRVKLQVDDIKNWSWRKDMTVSECEFKLGSVACWSQIELRWEKPSTEPKFLNSLIEGKVPEELDRLFK